MGHFHCPRCLRNFPVFLFFFSHPTVFHLFPPFCLHLISSFSVSFSLLLVPSRVLIISVIALIITAWFFFISSRSMVNMFISSRPGPPVYLLVTPLSFQDFGHLCSHYFEFCSRRLPISSPFVCFGGFLSCTFTSCIFFSLFILFRLLWFWSTFCRLEGYGSTSLWNLPFVGGLDQWLVKV